MSNQIVVLGGGLVGRFAKVIMPEVIVLERKNKNERIIGEFLGANMSRLPVPELDYTEGVMLTKINGENPTIEKIKEYKYIKTGSSDFDFGDIKQFMPKQKIFFIKKPDVNIEYNCNVTNIDVLDKTITIDNGVKIKYGCIISTIPMNNLLDLIELFKNSIMKSNSFLFYKIIYYKEEETNNILEKNTFISNAIIGQDSIFSREQYFEDKISYESFFNFDKAIKLYPGKILYSNNAEEIARDLQLYNIYCYGRYARWRPKEHLHETFKNLRRFSERKGQIGYS